MVFGSRAADHRLRYNTVTMSYSSWLQNNKWRSIKVYLQPAVVRMLFLGYSAGLPLLLIFGTLSIWLTMAGEQRATVTYFSWAALAYSFKFVWAPIIDKLPIPFLFQRLGRRRSWMLVAQASIIIAISSMAMINPQNNITMMAVAAVLLGFSSATQDIVIDAYRIESQAVEYQAAMAAMYNTGYRIAMLMAGYVALEMVGWLGSEGVYRYSDWRTIYLIMAATMSIGVITTLLIPEPQRNTGQAGYLLTLNDYVRFFILFLGFTAGFVLAFIYLDKSAAIGNFLVETWAWHELIAGFFSQIIRMGVALLVAIALGYLLVLIRIVDRAMVWETYLVPVVDFFQRYRKTVIWILLLIGFYRVSDIVLGTIANVFYLEMGFTEGEIGRNAKLFGLIMTIIGGFIGGAMSLRYGVMRILLLGAILSAVTNLLFMWLASAGNDVVLLRLVIAADNLSAGIAVAAFIAYLSSLTNISFTAMQYAIFSSLMTLFPKLLGGYSGSIVDHVGYQNFFLITTLMGIPIIVLIIYLLYRATSSTDE